LFLQWSPARRQFRPWNARSHRKRRNLIHPLGRSLRKRLLDACLQGARAKSEREARGRWTMKAIVVTDRAAGTVRMELAERPKPQAAINDVVVRMYASGFVGTELDWPSTWTDRLDRDRTPSIPGHELAGVVTALGYGTTGLSVEQRVFGLADWYRDGA